MAAQTSVIQNLPQQHLSAFETFVQLCSDKRLLARPPGLAKNESLDGLNDETTLLRYFRARGFNPHRALEQFEEASITHGRNQIPKLYNEINVSDFEAARLLYPHWCGRRTKNGLPICIFDIGHLSQSTLNEYEKSRTNTGEVSITAVQRASIAHDTLTRFVFPLCTAMRDRPDRPVPISSALYLVDIAAFTMKQGWDIKNYTRDIGHWLMTGYPEIIHRLYVLNAPPYFAMMWSIMRKWLDPGTADKVVVVTAGETLSTLMKDIDIENIATRFGGELDWYHGKGVDIDVSIQEGLVWKGEKEFPPGPMKWVVDESGKRTAVAVGSIDGVARTARIAHVKVDHRVTETDPEKMVKMVAP